MLCWIDLFLLLIDMWCLKCGLEFDIGLELFMDLILNMLFVLNTVLGRWLDCLFTCWMHVVVELVFCTILWINSTLYIGVLLLHARNNNTLHYIFNNWFIIITMFSYTVQNYTWLKFVFTVWAQMHVWWGTQFWAALMTPMWMLSMSTLKSHRAFICSFGRQ